MDMIPQRRCTACDNDFPATFKYFHPDKRIKSGLRSVCRVCRNDSEAVRRQQRKVNPEKLQRHQQYQKQYRETHCAFVRQSQHQWYEAHKDEVKQRTKRHYWTNKASCQQYNKMYREKNRDRIKQRHFANKEQNNARSRQYCKTHLEEYKARNRKRHALKKLVGGMVTAQDVQKQFAAQRKKCYYCDVKLSKFHVDHVVPISKGGRNIPENIVITCPTCNLRKHDKLLHEWPEGNRLM